MAEIFSWYFPQEVHLHMFNTGQSLEEKQKNWHLLSVVSTVRHSLLQPEMENVRVFVFFSEAIVMIFRVPPLVRT